MIEVVEVEVCHVRRGKRVRAVWTARAVNRQVRPHLYDLVTIVAVAGATKNEAIKRARIEARRQGGVS